MSGLRPVARRDGPALHAILGPSAESWLGLGPLGKEECCHLALQWEKDRRFWAVEQDGEALGLLYLAPLAERGGGQWELGYALRQDEQGRGLATWACCLLLDQGFASGQVQRVNAFCRPDNRASRRLLRRLGFWKRERRLKNGCLSFDRWGRPCWRDALEYTMTAAAWQRRRGGMGPNGEGLLQHFRRCTNWMHRVHNRLEGGECGGLHHGQGKLLATLLQQDGCSQRELCGLLQIRPASLSELLDKLERSGAVERRQSPDDRRVSCGYLTDLGRERPRCWPPA